MQDVTITVTNINESPGITSAAVVSVAENQVAAIDVQSSDPDGQTEDGGGLTYSLTGGVDRSLFIINRHTGVLTFLSTPDFELPGDMGGDNIYEVRVTVTDGQLSSAQDIAVTVTNVNEAPVITSGSMVSVHENQNSIMDVEAFDSDGDTEGDGLTYHVSGGTDAALFAIDPDSGALTFSASPDFENPNDTGANNIYEVEVTVTDSSGLTVQKNIAVTVTNLNEPPSITSNSTVNVAENQTAVINVQSSDLDGQTEDGGGLTYSLTGGVDRNLFLIDRHTGILRFQSAPNFESPGDLGGDNRYDVQVTVNDGQSTSFQDIAVTVTNVNEPPTITSAAMVSIPENQSAVNDVQSSDIDGQTEGGGGLTYSLSGVDKDLFTLDVNSGALAFISAPDFEVPRDFGADNVYEVHITVSDGELSDVQDLRITVTDADAPPTVTLSVDDANIEEAGGVATFTAILSTAYTLPVTVNLGFSGTATLNADYTRSTTQILIPAGATSGTLTVTAKQDTPDEVDETVVVEIIGVTNAVEFGTQTQVTTIADDDTPPTVILSVDTASIGEASGVATFTATLSSVSSLPVTIDLGFSGVAALTDDYTRSGSQIVIPAGATSGTLTVTATQDILDEADEALIVEILNVVNGTELGTQSQTTKIVDDDNQPVVILSVDRSDISEAGGAATFTATLSSVSSLPVTINLAFGGTATLTSDYTRSGSQIVIAAGDSSGSVTITAAQDSLDEVNETVSVDIASVINATLLGTQSQTTTINDDDDPPTVTLSVDNSTIDEASGVATFTATLSAVSSLPVTVNFGFGGTATLTDDYTPSGTQIVIAPGTTTGTFTVTAPQDTLDEINESVIVDITSVTNGSESGTQSQTVTISDDDLSQALDFGDAEDSIATPRYPTLLSHDGARHVITSLFLGAGVDSDVDGQPTAKR